MPETNKWVAYDVARSRLLIEIGEVNHLIDQEEAAAIPDTAKIAALEAKQSDLIDQSDLLSADDIESNLKIASKPRN